MRAPEEAKDQEAAKRGGMVQPHTKPHFHEDEDPINYLGSGIVSYFDLLRTMVFVFFILTLLHLPVMSLYSKYDNYKDETTEVLPKLMSLGNLGFSMTKCASTGMATDTIILSCKTGLIRQIVDFNIASPDESKDLCVRNTTSVCANTYQPTTVRADMEKCIGKQQCKVTGIKKYVTSKKDICLNEDAEFSVQFYCH